MGGVRGSVAVAAAAVVLASAVGSLDVPEKWHLKVAPMLVYAVPVSMPVVPLSSGSCGSAVESFGPFSGSVWSRVLWRKDERGVESEKCCGREAGYAASDFSLAQGASGSGSFLGRRAIGHLLPVCVATSVTPPVCVAQSGLGYCGVGFGKRPVLAPFCFSPPGLYSAPVTERFVAGGLRTQGTLIGGSRFVSSFSRDRVSGLASAPQSHSSSAYLESLLSSLLSLQSAVPNNYSHAEQQPAESLHAWHARDWTRSAGADGNDGGDGDGVVKKPVLTVVLLGWLGAQQKHLKKYAEWYNARGIHAVTFVIPMTDILSFHGQGNAEEHVDSLARHLAQWLSDQGEHADLEGEKQLIFHTFSNTGWLTYGAILEKMQEQGGHLVGRIKGCVVDSAPVPDPDPQVWASGFSAALLKKRSSATKPTLLKGEVEEGVTVAASALGTVENLEVSGANGLETAFLSVLEGFFSLFLKLPAISRRLSEVVTVLQKEQPPCPQLYIYSTADKVIPVKSVEAFIEEQRKTGRVVRACNLQSSPHVDHFRSHPQLYSEQLNNFLKEVLPSTPAQPHTL